MPWPPPVPTGDRADTTPQLGLHPTDHDQIHAALADIVTRVDLIDAPGGAPGEMLIKATAADYAFAWAAPAAGADIAWQAPAVPPGTTDTYGNPDTVVAGEIIETAWANAAAVRVVRTFPTSAAVTAWAAPDGATAVTLDNGWYFRRVKGAWIAGFPGVQTFAAEVTTPDTVAVTGTQDTLNQPIGFAPAPIRMSIDAVTWFGNASGWVNAQSDLWLFAAGVARAATPMTQAIVPTAWAPIPIHYAYDVATGAEMGFKVRLNVMQAQGTPGWFSTRARYTATYL